MPKYVAIIEICNGTQLGATIEARSQAEAWKKLVAHRCIENARSVELAVVFVPEDEIK